MIIALTGATGFLGGHVLRRLVDAGHQVRALTRRSQPDQAGVTWVEGDLQTPGTLSAGAEAIIHCAGVVNAPDAAGFDRGNRLGTQAIIEAAQAAGVKRFIHISSLAAREPGLSLYGASKYAAEDAVVNSSLEWVVVRPPAIYGPGDTELRDMFRLAKYGLAILPPAGRLSVIHADDLARLIVTLAVGGPSRVIYDPDDGVQGGWSHRDFGRAIGAAVGRRVVTVAVPGAVLRLGAAIDGALRGAGAKLTADRAAYIAHPDWFSDPAHHVPVKIWKPEIGTPDGLAATADWYRGQGWI